MDTLTKLLAVEVPANTSLRSAELTFRGLLPWWLATLIFLVLVGVSIYLYRLERGTMGWPRRFVMIVLRCALLGLVLLLLARPVLLAEFVGQRPRGVVVLLDNSQSMQLQDRRLADTDRWRVAIAHGLVPAMTPLYEGKMAEPPAQTPKDPPRADLVQAVLRHPELKLLERLQQHGPVRPYLFGADLRGTTEESGNLAGFKADEPRTALADAILKSLQAKDADPPTAIVAITDGQDNASKFTLLEAAQACKDAGIPLHLYGVGTAEGGSLQLREVGAPETIFVDDVVSVPLRWRAQGFKTGNVEITLNLTGRQVAKKLIPVQTGEDLRDVLSFTVPKGQEAEEVRDLVATIVYKDADGFRDAQTRSVRVVDRKIRVLYIENSPRWEFKFLQPALLRDRRIEPHFLLVHADPKVAQSGPPFLSEFPTTREKFFEARYNIIILGDVAASYLGREHMDWIQEFVKNRGGLIVLAGRQHMPSEFESTPLGEVLPVEFRPYKAGFDTDVRTQEYAPTLTETGERSEMLALADAPQESLDIWKKLPGFHWQYPVTKLRPGAQALLVNPRAKMGDQPMPLLASQFYGRGQVVFLGSDETWRWRWNFQDKYFIRFWGQLLYQVGLPSLLGDSAKRVQAALERSQAVLGQPGSIFVRLLDKDYGPRKDAQVEATLEHMDAKPGQEKLRKVTLQAIPGRPGEYRALLTHDRAGRFELRVNNPESNTIPFSVEVPPGHEREESGLAEKPLRDMASISAGRFYREEDLHRLPDNVERRYAQFTRRQEVLLWGPLTLMLFVGLITVEWLVRKFSDLS
jgi:uncharacterized membrane protein